MPKIILEYLDVLIALLTGVVLYLIDATAPQSQSVQAITNAIDTKTLAGVSWIMGALLAVNRISYLRSVSEKLEPVNKLSEILDLTQDCDINGVSTLLKQYIRINADDFNQVKESIIEEATQKLLKLATDKTSDLLAAGDYYRWLYPYLENAGKKSVIRAISTGYEWEETPAEEKFNQLSIKACANGASFERLFVITKKDLSELIKNPVIKSQASVTDSNTIKAYFVDRDYLIKNDKVLLSSIDDGYIEFDNRVAMLDVSSEDNEVRGKVTMNEAKLKQLSKSFDSLMAFAKPLSVAMVEISPNNAINSDS